MKNPVCSINHFKKLLKKFKSISYRVIEDHNKSRYYNLFSKFIVSNDFENILDNLLKNFKSNPRKTKSALKYTISSDFNNSFYVSYTFEDENGKRSMIPKFIVFRVYVSVDYHRKKRLVKWSIPITWI